MYATCRPDPELAGTVLVTVSGRLDVHGATHLWEVASARLDTESRSMLLDLGGVDYISSAGVSALVRLLSRCRQVEGWLALFGCGPRVRMVMEMLMLEAILNVRDTAGAARERLRELGAG